MRFLAGSFWREAKRLKITDADQKIAVADGADAIMALIALEQSNTWKSYWELRKQAA